MLEDISQKQISATEVLEAFSRTKGSNFVFQVSRQKEQLRANRRVESINENCSELSEKQRQKLIAFCERRGGRLPIHIYRMLGNGRSQAEKNFALDFIENFEEIEAEILKVDEELINKASDDDLLDLQEERLQRILGSESSDSGMFWTFVPYIFKNLSSKDLDTQDRIRKICNWGIMAETPKSVLDEEIEARQVHLKGFRDVWNSLGGQIYYLAIDPKDATHKFTDQEAEKLVKAGVFD